MSFKAPTALNQSKGRRPGASLSVCMPSDRDDDDQSQPGSGRLRALARHLGKLAAAEAMRASMSPALPPASETTNDDHD
jgi:hypothetical protein